VGGVGGGAGRAERRQVSAANDGNSAGPGQRLHARLGEAGTCPFRRTPPLLMPAYVCLYEHGYACMYACASSCPSVCVCMCACVPMHVCTCVRACLWMLVRVCVCLLIPLSVLMPLCLGPRARLQWKAVPKEQTVTQALPTKFVLGACLAPSCPSGRCTQRVLPLTLPPSLSLSLSPSTQTEQRWRRRRCGRRPARRQERPPPSLPHPPARPARYTPARVRSLYGQAHENVATRHS
jgi:hypothetical protein